MQRFVAAGNGAQTARRRKSICLLAALLVALGTPVGLASQADAQTGSFTPTDDAYVDDTKPNTNYGSSSSLRVDSTPLRTAYMKFDVQGMGTVDSAAVRITAESKGDDVSLYVVADTTWDEATITAATAPAVGALISTHAPVENGKLYVFDVSSIVQADGVYAFALRTSDNTAIKFSSSEGSSSPELLIPAPGSPSPFLVTRSGTTYTATSQSNGTTYTGTAKFVVEAAVDDLMQFSGGTITFSADTFDFGSDHLELDVIAGITFEGQGMGATTLINDSTAADDTEIFDIVDGDDVIIRDMTVSAGGSARSTSDALDFDDGRNITVQRVEIVDSRARGIVFDGKGAGWTADNNRILDCVITGIPGDGIEFLASSNNLVDGCTISNVGGHGIQINKSSTSADQPNKQSNNNVIQNTTIDQSGQDGVNINSGDGNQIIDNVITNSANVTSNKDGIRITSANSVSCDNNLVAGNTVTDTQATKTQRYGLNISSSLCTSNVIGDGNDFSGNLIGDINDIGTNTQYPVDSEAPSVPTGVSAVAASHFEVDVSWTASSDNVGVTEYGIYRDGTLLATVGGEALTYRDSTAAASTTYDYTVDAADAAGNRSAQSSPPATVTTPAASGSVTVNPAADAYVNSSNDTRNYGSSTALRTDASPDLRSYLRFDVSGVSGTVTQATLRIYANSSSSVGFDASVVSDLTWTESGITYATAPVVGSVLDSTGSFSSGAYLELDVTAHVTGNGSFAFAITTPSSTAISMGSRESANPPELVISSS